MVEHKIPWPRLKSGALALDTDTFRDVARSHSIINPIRELRVSLSQTRLTDLAVRADGRNRSMLSAFSSKTGRNQPSNTEFIFGPAVWLRGLIRPDIGTGLAYLDWSQQELGIAAALSNDNAMLGAYQTGDAYLGFAKQTGAVPQYGTTKTHPDVREQFKGGSLGAIIEIDVSLCQI